MTPFSELSCDCHVISTTRHGLVVNAYHFQLLYSAPIWCPSHQMAAVVWTVRLEVVVVRVGVGAEEGMRVCVRASVACL